MIMMALPFVVGLVVVVTDSQTSGILSVFILFVLALALTQHLVHLVSLFSSLLLLGPAVVEGDDDDEPDFLDDELAFSGVDLIFLGVELVFLGVEPVFLGVLPVVVLPVVVLPVVVLPVVVSTSGGSDSRQS